ncbi:MAG: galactokinase [Lachnospiraceae bacterium]
MTIQEVAKKFQELFGETNGAGTFFAPGRVNLIGEHTDYNGGHVFPCALTMGIYGVMRKREDRVLRFYSLDFPEDGVVMSSLDELAPLSDKGWTAYPKGVVWAFAKKGYVVPAGFDFVIGGDIPSGSGLSSSAALEVLTGAALRDTFGFTDLTNVDLALIGQLSENEYNGMQCGIMDQFASAMGKEDCAIYLDTSRLEYTYAPLQLADASIVITNSKVKHALVGSPYNDRRRDCAKALACFKEHLPIEALGEMTVDQFETYKDLLPDPVVRVRARHAVYENARTIQALSALQAGNLARFGELMNASHVSLRDDYEVSCPELDLLAAAAWEVPGVIGSRMTGGGFGGCTVSIVENAALPQFQEALTSVYEDAYGKCPEFYIVRPGEGARALEM